MSHVGDREINADFARESAEQRKCYRSHSKLSRKRCCNYRCY